MSSLLNGESSHVCWMTQYKKSNPAFGEVLGARRHCAYSITKSGEFVNVIRGNVEVYA
jgi:hypothetical protein